MFRSDYATYSDETFDFSPNSTHDDIFQLGTLTLQYVAEFYNTISQSIDTFQDGMILTVMKDFFDELFSQISDQSQGNLHLQIHVFNHIIASIPSLINTFFTQGLQTIQNQVKNSFPHNNNQLYDKNDSIDDDYDSIDDRDDNKNDDRINLLSPNTKAQRIIKLLFQQEEIKGYIEILLQILVTNEQILDRQSSVLSNLCDDHHEKLWQQEGQFDYFYAHFNFNANLHISDDSLPTISNINHKELIQGLIQKHQSSILSVYLLEIPKTLKRSHMDSASLTIADITNTAHYRDDQTHIGSQLNDSCIYNYLSQRIEDQRKLLALLIAPVQFPQLPALQYEKELALAMANHLGLDFGLDNDLEDNDEDGGDDDHDDDTGRVNDSGIGLYHTDNHTLEDNCGFNVSYRPNQPSPTQRYPQPQRQTLQTLSHFDLPQLYSHLSKLTILRDLELFIQYTSLLNNWYSSAYYRTALYLKSTLVPIPLVTFKPPPLPTNLIKVFGTQPYFTRTNHATGRMGDDHPPQPKHIPPPPPPALSVPILPVLDHYLATLTQSSLLQRELSTFDSFFREKLFSTHIASLPRTLHHTPISTQAIIDLATLTQAEPPRQSTQLPTIPLFTPHFKYNCQVELNQLQSSHFHPDHIPPLASTPRYNTCSPLLSDISALTRIPYSKPSSQSPYYQILISTFQTIFATITTPIYPPKQLLTTFIDTLRLAPLIDPHGEIVGSITAIVRTFTSQNQGQRGTNSEFLHLLTTAIRGQLYPGLSLSNLPFTPPRITQLLRTTVSLPIQGMDLEQQNLFGTTLTSLRNNSRRVIKQHSEIKRLRMRNNCASNEFTNQDERMAGMGTDMTKGITSQITNSHRTILYGWDSYPNVHLIPTTGLLEAGSSQIIDPISNFDPFSSKFDPDESQNNNLSLQDAALYRTLLTSTNQALAEASGVDFDNYSPNFAKLWNSSDAFTGLLEANFNTWTRTGTEYDYYDQNYTQKLYQDTIQRLLDDQDYKLALDPYTVQSNLVFPLSLLSPCSHTLESISSDFLQTYRPGKESSQQSHIDNLPDNVVVVVKDHSNPNGEIWGDNNIIRPGTALVDEELEIDKCSVGNQLDISLSLSTMTAPLRADPPTSSTSRQTTQTGQFNTPTIPILSTKPSKLAKASSQIGTMNNTMHSDFNTSDQTATMSAGHHQMFTDFHLLHNTPNISHATAQHRRLLLQDLNTSDSSLELYNNQNQQAHLLLAQEHQQQLQYQQQRQQRQQQQQQQGNNSSGNNILDISQQLYLAGNIDSSFSSISPTQPISSTKLFDAILQHDITSDQDVEGGIEPIGSLHWTPQHTHSLFSRLLVGGQWYAGLYPQVYHHEEGDIRINKTSSDDDGDDDDDRTKIRKIRGSATNNNKRLIKAIRSSLSPQTSPADLSFDHGLLANTITSHSITTNLSGQQQSTMNQLSSRRSNPQTRFDFLTAIISSLSSSTRHNWTVIIAQLASTLAHYTLSTPLLSTNYHNYIFQALSTRFSMQQLQTFVVIQSDIKRSAQFSLTYLNTRTAAQATNGIHNVPRDDESFSHYQSTNMRTTMTAATTAIPVTTLIPGLSLGLNNFTHFSKNIPESLRNTHFSLLICSHILWPKNWEHMGIFSSLQYLISSGDEEKSAQRLKQHKQQNNYSMSDDTIGSSTPDQDQYSTWARKISTSDDKNSREVCTTNQIHKIVNHLAHGQCDSAFHEEMVSTNSHDMVDLGFDISNYNKFAPFAIQTRKTKQNQSNRDDLSPLGSFQFFNFYLKRCNRNMLYAYYPRPPESAPQLYPSGNGMLSRRQRDPLLGNPRGQYQFNSTSTTMADSYTDFSGNNGDSDDENLNTNSHHDTDGEEQPKQIPSIHLPVEIRKGLDMMIEVSNMVYQDHYLVLLEHMGVVEIEVELKRRVGIYQRDAQIATETITKRFLCSPVAFSVLSCFAEDEYDGGGDNDCTHPFGQNNSSDPIINTSSIQQFNPYSPAQLPPNLAIAPSLRQDVSLTTTLTTTNTMMSTSLTLLARSKFPILTAIDVAAIVHITTERATVILDYWTNQGCLLSSGNAHLSGKKPATRGGFFYTSADSFF